MRLLFPVLLILLVVVLVGFLITNPGEQVTVTLFYTTYPDVPLFLVVFLSLAVGVGFTATIALIEGATIRLGNHRLRREVQRLETENSYLRTQPRTPTGEEPALPRSGVSVGEEGPAVRRSGPPSAPVYDVSSSDPATRGD